MKNWKAPPLDSRVAKYVECYWFLKKEPGDTGNNHPQLNPDPVAHLILAADDYSYCYTLDDFLTQGNGSHWILPHSKTFTMDHTKPFEIVGVKFRVGALYSLSIRDPQSNLNYGYRRQSQSTDAIRIVRVI